MSKILYIAGSVAAFLLVYYTSAILVSLIFITYCMSRDSSLSGVQLFNTILDNYSYVIVILSFLLLTLFYILLYKLKRYKASELIHAGHVSPASIIFSVLTGFSFYLVLRYCLSFIIGDEQSFYINISHIYSITSLDRSSLTYVLSAIIVLPILEETAHRGILYSILKRRLSTGQSLVLQAVVYALIYTKPHVMAYMLVLGLIAGIVYIWHKSILLPIVIHLSFNAAALIVNISSISKLYGIYDRTIFMANAFLIPIFLIILYRLSVKSAHKGLTLVK